MIIQCCGCGGETQEKKGISKRTGRPYTLYNCLGDCKNEQGYPLSTFPPRNSPAPQAQSTPTPNLEKHFASIATSLQEIVGILRLWKDPIEKAVRQNEQF